MSTDPVTPPIHHAGRVRLLPFSNRTAVVLHRVSIVLAATTVVGLESAGRAGWLSYRPGAETFEITARPAFLALFVLGAVLAWRWEILGGIVAAFTAAGVMVWEGQLLQPLDAGVVIAAFLIPGAIWIILDLHDQPPVRAVLGVTLAGLAAASGLAVSDHIYDGLFGPSHPSSSASLPDGLASTWMWVGGVTSSSAVVTAKLDDIEPPPVLVVSEIGGSGSARSFTGELDTHDIARFELTGLSADTVYNIALATDDAAGPAVTEATVHTFPDGPASFTIAAGACARVGSNGAVFDAIAELDPSLFIIDGDFHYANITGNTPDQFRDVLDYTLEQPGQSALYRSTPIAYVWDDHDYGGNNGDSSSPTRPAALAVYREYVPHYPLATADSPIYQAFDIGRVQVVLTDVRSARSPASQSDDAAKSMLGADQQRWLEQQLLTGRDTRALTIWVNPVPWVGEPVSGADDWRGYSTERSEIANFIADNHIDNLLMLSGDAHMVAIDDGTNTDYSTSRSGGFPLLHAGALDRPGHTKGGPYSHGAVAGGGQFGVIDIEDRGDTLIVALAGMNWKGETLLEYQFEVPTRP